MRVYRSITIDIATGAVLAEDSFDYAGLIEECKKGREQADKAAAGSNRIGDTASGLATANTKLQKGYAKKGDAFGLDLLPNANGELSPYAKAQLEQQKRDIAKTYADTAAVGLRGIAARGMGNAPTGLASSVYNTAGRNAGEAETNAYAEGMKNTLGQGLKGLDYIQGQESIFDPARALAAATGGYSTAGTVAANSNKMGSTLGDIGSGIGTLATIGAGL